MEENVSTDNFKGLNIWILLITCMLGVRLVLDIGSTSDIAVAWFNGDYESYSLGSNLLFFITPTSLILLSLYTGMLIVREKKLFKSWFAAYQLLYFYLGYLLINQYDNISFETLEWHANEHGWAVIVMIVSIIYVSTSKRVSLDYVNT